MQVNYLLINLVKNMEIIEIEIDKIKPDSDNPRTVIEEEELKEMAQSIITEGIINPIEVDKDFMIITGERRWRAAKLAGFKTIPAKIMDLDKNQRFLRQVVENIQHNAMSDWDTANAFKKIIEAGWLKSSQPKSSPIPITRDHGVRWLSRKIGKSKDYITEKLDILEASGDFQQAVKCGEMAG
ncbi:MAG: ParB/RepB/Spo0J family partition protein, partial [Candidatus Woesebacteria bacterium]|nr:ParB/RepB/Spo0J family partition protein [Candidatus Woesebacteria bacterium]